MTTQYQQINSQIGAIETMAQQFVSSGLFGCERLGQGFTIALDCAVTGASPLQFLRRYHILGGKVVLKAGAALADFRAAGGKHKWLQWGDTPTGKTEAEHYAELWLKSPDGEEVTYRYSLADARKEGVLKQGSRYDKRPGQMLRARCSSNAINGLTPEIYAGGDDDEDESAAPAEQKLDLAVMPAPPAPTPVATVAPVADPVPVPTVPSGIDFHAALERKQADAPTTTAPAADQPELAQMGLAPIAAAELPEDMLKQLEAACADIAPQAVYFFRSCKWIENNQGAEHLSPKRAKFCLDNVPAFRAKVLAVAASRQPSTP